MCIHVCVNVCYAEGCSTPNRCHYFLLSSPHLCMTAEVFLLFCLCFQRERERDRKKKVARSVFVCAYVWVGAPQSGSQKVPDTFPVLSAWPENCGRSHFQPKPGEHKSYGASSVTTWWLLVWVSAKNTSSYSAEEKHFDLAPCSRRVKEVEGYRPGWVEWDDIINYIIQKLSGIILSRGSQV